MISDRLLQHLINTEGFSSRPYWDRKQYSIGYGTKAKGRNDRVTKAQAMERKRAHLGMNARHVDARFSNLPPGIRDALISLSYNSGNKWMNKGLGKAVAGGNYADAKHRFLQYVNSNGERLPGLVRRRQKEAGWWDDKTPPSQGVGAAPGSFRASQEVGMDSPLNSAPAMPARNPQRVQQPQEGGFPKWHWGGNGPGQEVSGDWSIEWSNGTPVDSDPVAVGPKAPQEPAGLMQPPQDAIGDFLRTGSTPGTHRAAQEVGMKPSFRSSQDVGMPEPTAPMQSPSKPEFEGKPTFGKSRGFGMPATQPQFGGPSGFSKPWENPQAIRQKQRFGPFSAMRGFGRFKGF